MRYLPLIIVLLLPCWLFAQTDTKPDCPTIDIAGPDGVPKPGDPITFTGRVEPVEKYFKLEYIWALSDGKIVKGQGTLILEAAIPESLHLTVSLEIKGLPEGCPNIASETISVDPPPKAELIETFHGPITKKDQARVDRMLVKEQEDPSAHLVILLGASSMAKLKAIKQMLFKLVPPRERRVIFVESDSNADLIEVWFVPAGASDPVPGKDGTVTAN